MRFRTIVSMVAIVAAAADANGQPDVSRPVPQVGVYGYDADDTTGLAAYHPQPSTNSVVTMKSLCMVTGGNSEPRAGMTDAWRFSGKVLSLTAEEAVLDLEWQR